MSTVLCQDNLLIFESVAGETEADLKAQIDAMIYEDMLRLVRNAALSHPLFRGEVGKHFHATLRTKRHALPPDERAAISKAVGF